MYGLMKALKFHTSSIICSITCIVSKSVYYFMISGMVGNSSSWTFMLQQLNDASMSSCVWPTIKKYTNPSLKMPLAQTTNCMWRAGGKVLQGWGVQGVPTMKTYKPLYPLASPHKRVSFHHHHIGTWGLWRTPLGTLEPSKPHINALIQPDEQSTLHLANIHFSSIEISSIRSVFRVAREVS